MKRAVSFAAPSRRSAAVLILFVLAFALLSGCNYGRMHDDEAIQAFNAEFPQMPKRTIPVGGGIWVEREANPLELINMLPQTPQVVAYGEERYRFYCVHCHGARLDGNSTVGQSFAPLPRNLKSADVQDQTDGELFYKIRFGFLRHPPLYSTATDEETWAVLRYVRASKK
ncbi:MAG: cytochrome c [Syntrophobacteraceae bacterium]